MPRYIDFSQKPKEVRVAAHAIGLDYKRPYQRHGKFFYRPYRNYFSTHDKAHDYSAWQGLCERGYAESGPVRISGNHHNQTFWLTRAGLDWLGDVAPPTGSVGGHFPIHPANLKQEGCGMQGLRSAESHLLA